MEEIWKPIFGYEGRYEVSSAGNVKTFNFKGSGKEKLLIVRPNCQGYVQVGLYKGEGKITFSVHRLVAETFILNPENKPDVNHLNGVRHDNRVENLEWCTKSENIIHSFKFLGRVNTWEGKFGKENPFCKPVFQYTSDGVFIREFESVKTAQDTLGIHQISSVCLGRKYRKTAGGFIWSYKKL